MYIALYFVTFAVSKLVEGLGMSFKALFVFIPKVLKEWYSFLPWYHEAYESNFITERNALNTYLFHKCLS